MLVLPGHELIEESLAEDLAGMQRQVAEAKAADDRLPPAYWDHPVVQQHPEEDVRPDAIYMDAVPYSLTDSVIGVWLVCLLSSRRYLVAIIRKRMLCKFGCAGFCIFFHLLRFVHWFLKCMAEKTYPMTLEEKEKLEKQI